MNVEGMEMSLVETVSDLVDSSLDARPATKGTPIFTDNFDSLCGEQFYATAFC